MFALLLPCIQHETKNQNENFSTKKWTKIAILENVLLVKEVELLEEDECEDGVGPEASIVGREALPQAQHALFLNDLAEDFLFFWQNKNN